MKKITYFIFLSIFFLSCGKKDVEQPELPSLTGTKWVGYRKDEAKRQVGQYLYFETDSTGNFRTEDFILSRGPSISGFSRPTKWNLTGNSIHISYNRGFTSDYFSGDMNGNYKWDGGSLIMNIDGDNYYKQ